MNLRNNIFCWLFPKALAILDNMMKKIKLNNTEIEYKIRKNKRAKRMRLAVYGDASVVVTMPWWANERKVESFVEQKFSWLLQKINFFKNHIDRRPKIDDRKDYLANKERARVIIEQKIGLFNKLYNFRYKKITVKNQKTRWGSCSREGNLNFNYKIIYLPENLSDYIIVHELCHLKEMNHGKKFWDLVSLAMPKYLSARKELRKKSLGLV